MYALIWLWVCSLSDIWGRNSGRPTTEEGGQQLSAILSVLPSIWWDPFRLSDNFFFILPSLTPFASFYFILFYYVLHLSFFLSFSPHPPVCQASRAWSSEMLLLFFFFFFSPLQPLFTFYLQEDIKRISSTSLTLPSSLIWIHATVIFFIVYYPLSADDECTLCLSEWL